MVGIPKHFEVCKLILSIAYFQFGLTTGVPNYEM